MQLPMPGRTATPSLPSNSIIIHPKNPILNLSVCTHVLLLGVLSFDIPLFSLSRKLKNSTVILWAVIQESVEADIERMPNWELKDCCKKDQVAFLTTVGIFTVVILILWRTFLLTPFKLITVFLHEASHAIACKLTCGEVEGIEVHANEGGVTQTRGGVYWLILPAGYLGSSFWGLIFILASTNLLTARIAAGCLAVALLVVLFVAKNWTLRGLCIGFIIFLAIIWVLQETTKIHILRYIILFIGVMNSLFSVYDIYDDLISRRVNSSDAEKFAEVCPCPCNGVAWGVIWGMISFIFLCGGLYLGLVILS